MPLSASFGVVWNRYCRWRKRGAWESRWRDPSFRPGWLADSPRPFVVSGFERGWLAPRMKVLEIGCGLGTAAAWLAQRGLHVVAIDVSSHAVERASKRYSHQPGLEFLHADACAPANISTVFDVIIDTGCLQHIPDNLRRGYCQNLLVWSCTGTRFVVTMHKKDRSSGERLSEVQSLFSANFDLADTEEAPPTNKEVKYLNSVFHFVRR